MSTGFISYTPATMSLVMVRVVCGGGQKEKSRAKVRASLIRRERRLHSLVSRFMPAIGEVSFGLALAAQKGEFGEDNLVIAEDPDSDAYDPLLPLPHEQAGLPSREINTPTLTVYPRKAANIP